MNCSSLRVSSAFRLLRLSASLLVSVAALGLTAFAADNGTVTGSVTSSSTHNALQGALVSIPSLNRSVFTDSAGQFSISGVPTGALDLVISYQGFEEAREKVSVTSGSASSLEIVMKSSELITMQPFTVESVKEGQALAITQQRNSVNPKNVTAFDEWGVLPTQNVGELASRLPGVIVGAQDEDNLIMNVSVRGQPASYTRINVDGMLTTGVMADGRSVSLHAFSGSQYEQIEIIAGMTPDKRADGLGGQLNLKTRSPLAQSERRRSTFTASMRWVPSWSNRSHELEGHDKKPDLSFSYTEVFDVLGGHRNLGIVLQASYQEVMNPHNWSSFIYENTTNPTAFNNNYLRQSGYNDRFISALSGRVDYKFSPTTTASLRFLYNAGSEPYFYYAAVNPQVGTALTVFDPVTNPGGAIMPGYTATRTEIRPVGTITANTQAQMLLNPQRYSFTSKNPTATMSFDHNWGALKVDHAYRVSNTHWDSGAGRQREDGTLTLRTNAPIGFILDRSDPNGKVFTQTSGPSVYSASSYAAYQVAAANTTTQPVPTTSVIFNSRDTITDTTDWSANVNATYNLSTSIPVTLKGGLDTINRRINGRQPYNQRWYGVVGAVLPTDGLMPLTEFERQSGGPRLPVLDPAWIRRNVLNNPAYFYQDLNLTATSIYTGRRILEEGVDAAYIQGSTKIGKLTLLGGVRKEWVKTESFTYFFKPTRTLISVEPDHFKRAAMDAVRQSIDGSYDKLFPSMHASYDITKNFRAQASWSTSYGRPALTQIVGAVTPNDAARTVTAGNPALKPQMAKSIDLKLEYYLSEGGLISVTGYQKKITDYIGSQVRSGTLIGSGPTNGFDGQYEGYELVQSGNLGSATLKGFEIDVRRRLSFLPGMLKGLTARANYTYLKTNGRFGGTVDLANGQVAGFIPRSYNFGLSYNYGKFGASYDVNYTGRFPTSYSLTSPGNGTIYRDNVLLQNAGFTYKLRPNVTAFFNLNNFAQDGMRQYTYLESRTSLDRLSPRAVKVGVTGQF